MNRLFNSKKGFTLVELILTVSLLGLGSFALLGLFKAANTAFEKTQDRFKKQEMVKLVAELLQNGTNINMATSASIFDNAGILPAYGKADSQYTYLYALPVIKSGSGYTVKNSTFKTEEELDASKFAGYYIYVLDAGIPRPQKEKPLNDGVPLLFNMRADVNEEDGSNLAGLRVSISAIDDGSEVDLPKVPEKVNTTQTQQTGTPKLVPKESSLVLPNTTDDISYELDVGYHFPNMISQKMPVVVNCSTGNTEDLDCASIGDTLVPSVSEGCILRITADTTIFGDNTNADLTATSFCFIATASYGFDSGEVGLLCDFRDNVLLKNDLGKMFVKAYYTLSPSVADIIRNSDALKAVVRTSLKPCVAVATYALNPDLVKEEMPLLIIFMASGLVLSSSLVYFNKKRKREE